MARETQRPVLSAREASTGQAALLGAEAVEAHRQETHRCGAGQAEGLGHRSVGGRRLWNVRKGRSWSCRKINRATAQEEG